jgi:hypothetical protein
MLGRIAARSPAALSMTRVALTGISHIMLYYQVAFPDIFLFIRESRLPGSLPDRCLLPRPDWTGPRHRRARLPDAGGRPQPLGRECGNNAGDPRTRPIALPQSSAADVCGTQGAACGSCSWLNLLGAPGVSIAIGVVRTGSRSKPEALFMRVFGMQVKHDSQSHSRLTIHDCQ